MMHRKLRRFGIGSAIVLLLLEACAPPTVAPAAAQAGLGTTMLDHGQELYQRKQAQKPATVVAGWVQFGGPVKGATVAVLGTDGQPTGRQATTSARGTFMILADGLPKDFTLKASGGTIGTQAFTGDLRADVQQLSAANDMVGINVVSTLVTRYRQAKPTTPVAFADRMARSLLGIDRYRASDRLDHDFNLAAFMQDANAAGGVDAFMTSLAGEMGSASKVRSYVTRKRSAAFQTKGLASWVGEQLASGVIGSLTGMALGDALSAVGLGGPSLDDVLNQLGQISDELAVIHNQLSDIESGLGVASASIKYGQAAETVLTDFAAVKDAELNLRTLVGHMSDTATSPSDAAAESRTFADPAYSYFETTFKGEIEVLRVGGLTKWDEAIRGTGNVTGMIPLYSAKVATRNPNFYHAYMASAIDTWWDNVDAHEAMLAHVLKEYARRYDSMPASLATSTFGGTLQTNRQAQIQMLKGTLRARIPLASDDNGNVTSWATPASHVPAGVVIDLRQNLAWTQGRPDAPLSVQWPSGVQAGDADALIDPSGWSGMTGWTDPTADQLMTLSNWNAGAPYNDIKWYLGGSGFAITANNPAIMSLPSFWDAQRTRPNPLVFADLGRNMGVSNQGKILWPSIYGMNLTVYPLKCRPIGNESYWYTN